MSERPDNTGDPSAVRIDPPARVAVTGATGYIGGRLAPRLREAGYRVRCLVRSPEKLAHRAWTKAEGVEVVECDIEDQEETARALEGCEAAYYLVHSMIAAGSSYAEHDRRLAASFAKAAREAGVRRVVYLGGLGEVGEDLSAHLASRREVEEALHGGGVPLTVLRAAMIIGSGSASFEILRYLVERLPVMVTPKWVRTECQPIAVRNVLHYLQACLVAPETAGRTLDIGGPEVMTYREIMRVMAEERGLPRRWIVPVPVLTPRLSSLWIGLVTPVTPRIARPLAEGLRNRVVCRDDEAARLMPQELLGVRGSIRAALGKVSSREVETIWSAAGPISGDPDWAGGTVFEDERTVGIRASASEVYRAVCRIGGGHGWYAADFLWRVRGWMDQAVGGPGLRRGRRDPEEVGYGEALDFWRVVGVERDRFLRLRAEMKLPGEAELSFRIGEREANSGDDDGRTALTMTARFRPKGLLGLLYWYAVLPLHGIVFSGMLRGIRRYAERAAGAGEHA